ncbi:MAG: DUF124 domain-containing protein [Parcubacteria bacterium C7867-004]|nr:MAG: DUF124 domain-containing protein [Parcubacteria bacterium C7867-004]
MSRPQEQLLAAYDAAPKAIQDTLSDGAGIDFMVGLQTRYGLHIDTVGSITELIRDMLLGLMKPDDFIGALQTLGIDTPTATRLVADLNKEVFMPLRDAIMTGGGSAMTDGSVRVPISLTTVPVAAATPAPQQSTPVLPPPALEYAAAPSPVTLPGSSVPAPMPVPAPAPEVARQIPVISEPPVAEVTPPIAPAPVSAPAVPLQVQHTVSTVQPASPIGWQSAASVHVYIPHPQTPPAPVPHPAIMQPEAVPQTVSYTEVPPAPQPPVFSAPIPPPQIATVPPPSRLPGSDPYREPIA